MDHVTELREIAERLRELGWIDTAYALDAELDTIEAEREDAELGVAG